MTEPNFGNGSAPRRKPPSQGVRGWGRLRRLIESPGGKPHLMLASWTGVYANSCVFTSRRRLARSFPLASLAADEWSMARIAEADEKTLVMPPEVQGTP